MAYMERALLVLAVVRGAAAVTICGHTPTICDGTFTGTTLYLNNQGLDGTIPTELFQYTQLTQLWLRYNQLSGTVPTEIGLLTQLTSLSLHVRCGCWWRCL